MLKLWIKSTKYFCSAKILLGNYNVIKSLYLVPGNKYVTVGKPTGQQGYQISRTCRNTRSSTKMLMEIKKKKRILLVD